MIRRAARQVLGTSAIVVGLAAGLGCKPESARQAERAADEVTEAREEVVKAGEQTVQGRRSPRELVTEAEQLARVHSEFEKRKALRVLILRAQHEVIATQPMLISTMATNFPLTDAGRADVNEKLTQLQHRLDEAANHIQGLQNADADVWSELDNDVIDAMKSLEEARSTAWEALDDAPKAARPST